MKKTRNSLQAIAGSKQMSFLPELDFIPKLPSKNTLAFRALTLMLQGHKISHPDFENCTASWRLAAHVFLLNKLGWPVQAIEIEHHAETQPITRHIRRYFLSTSVIKKIVKMGVLHE